MAVRIEQPVQVNDEIAHLCIVDGLLRLGPPGRIGGGIIRINSDDVELVEVLELGAVECVELAAEHEMEQLLGLGVVAGHDRSEAARLERGS